jgi:hypothetical protein
VAEVLVQFTDPVISEDGRGFIARACGAEMPDGRWHGWIEFRPADGGETLRSGRETTQPNRTDAEYWATGLTAVYLEGALHRAMSPLTEARRPAIPPPAFDGPAPDIAPASDRTESILDPFSVYRKGEALLRSQLRALSSWHLVNIVRAHGLSDLDPAVLNAMREPELVELIVAGVRAQIG